MVPVDQRSDPERDWFACLHDDERRGPLGGIVQHYVPPVRDGLVPEPRVGSGGVVLVPLCVVLAVELLDQALAVAEPEIGVEGWGYQPAHPACQHTVDHLPVPQALPVHVRIVLRVVQADGLGDSDGRRGGDGHGGVEAFRRHRHVHVLPPAVVHVGDRRVAHVGVACHPLHLPPAGLDIERATLDIVGTDQVVIPPGQLGAVDVARLKADGEVIAAGVIEHPVRLHWQGKWAWNVQDLGRVGVDRPVGSAFQQLPLAGQEMEAEVGPDRRRVGLEQAAQADKPKRLLAGNPVNRCAWIVECARVVAVAVEGRDHDGAVEPLPGLDFHDGIEGLGPSSGLSRACLSNSRDTNGRQEREDQDWQ